MSHSSISSRNPSGCLDLMARDALVAVQKSREEVDLRTQQVIHILKKCIDLCGYDLLNRIELRDRETGRIYR